MTAVETREPRNPSYLGCGEAIASVESAEVEVKEEGGDDARAKERNKSARKESM